MFDRVGNPEDRFSRIMAHLIPKPSISGIQNTIKMVPEART